MILNWLILFITLLFVNINADVNKVQHLVLAVAEHKANDIVTNNSPEQSSTTTSEKTLIRYDKIL